MHYYKVDGVKLLGLIERNELTAREFCETIGITAEKFIEWVSLPPNSFDVPTEQEIAAIEYEFGWKLHSYIKRVER